MNPELTLLTYNDVDSTSLQEITMVTNNILIIQGKGLTQAALICRIEGIEDPLPLSEAFTLTETTSTKVTAATLASSNEAKLTQIAVGDDVIWPK